MRKFFVSYRLILRYIAIRGLLFFCSIFIYVFISILYLFISPTIYRPLSAQGTLLAWSTPQRIVQVDGTINDLVVLGDAAGVVHVFFTELPQSGEDIGIEYMKLDKGKWSEPNTIMLESTTAPIRSLRVVIDKSQILHLLWVDQEQIYYSSASAATAGSAQAWSAPQVITQASTADILTSENGEIVVAGVDVDTTSLSLVRSSDGGRTWARGQIIAFCAMGSTAAYPRLARDGIGRLHLVWSEGEAPLCEPFTGVYYTRSLDDGATWEPPRKVDGMRHGEIGITAVGEDDIHLVWRSNIGGDGTFHQWSCDGGATWSTASQYEDNGGMSGLPSFVVDTAGWLHYVLGAVKYAFWDGADLSSYEDIATQTVRDSAAKSVELGTLAISSGNQLHALFEVDFQEIWYTTRLLDVPAQTPVAQSTPTAAATVARTPTAQTTPTEAWLAEDTSSNSTEQSIESTSARGLVRGAIAGAIVVVVVLAISLYRRRG